METNTSTVEIDLFLLLKKLWQKKFMIIFVALVFATAAVGVSKFVLTPEYTSTTRLYVVNQRDNGNGLTTQDLQAGDYLVKDYKEIIISKDVLVTVLDNLGLDWTKEQLLAKVSVSIPTNTRIISISVEDEDPALASLLANAIREVSAEKIKEITQVEKVTTMEVAEEATTPSSPNTRRNVILATLLGAFVAVASVLLSELLNDRVRRPEDIEDVLGMTLLGIVPDTSQLK